MAIKQRYGNWYCDFVEPGGKRIRRCLNTTDKKQAQELYDQLKAEAWRISKLGEIPDHTFDEACLRWINEKGHKRSLDDDRTKIAFFLTYFSGKSLSSLTENNIMQAVAKMPNRKHRQIWEARQDAALRKGLPVPDYVEKPVSAATRSQHLSFMRGLLKMAADEWKWIEKAPVIKVRKPISRRIRWLTQNEASTLIKCMPESFRHIVIFALATGLRRSNIIDLEWSQVDMQRKVAWIHPENAKAGRAIGVALNDTACKVLRDQIGRHNRYVFVHTKAKHKAGGGKTPEVRKLRVDDNSAWKTGLKRSGIKDFRFHDLRHTWASWLVQAGVPLSALQEMGGWESIEMVRRYAHLSPSHLTEHAKKIDEALGNDVTNLALLNNA
ncbi:site-specific integrase [Arsenophonus nasoniae]|uniref:Site-specific integrase n=1 Tax=Arsenophonus nasoniae TaxID=638 RepID=A0AA95GQH5_9GAMM|nr:site-specific integrase [Arsenophonus nasoniae]WGM00949.1 site-specific integrase [Arsenophonus nasoniae]